MEEENMVQDESSSQEYEGEGQYSEEEVDRIADTAIEAIQDILKYFNVGVMKASLSSTSLATIWLF